MNLADIFSGFRGNANASAAAPTPAAPAAQATSPAGVAAAGTLPMGETSSLERGSVATAAAPAGVPAPVVSASSLDEFAKMWQTSGSGNAPPSLNADPVKIGEAAKKIDFSKAVNPALAQKALNGDVAAFSQILNEIAQQTFAVATQTSTHLVDRHTAAVRDHIRGELPSELRRFQASDSLLAENSRLAHPAIQPLIQVIQAQFAAQFPQATASELKAHALKYLSGVMQAVAPDGTDFSANTQTASKQREAQLKDTFDWGGWADAQQPTQ